MESKYEICGESLRYGIRRYPVIGTYKTLFDFMKRDDVPCLSVAIVQPENGAELTPYIYVGGTWLDMIRYLVSRNACAEGRDLKKDCAIYAAGMCGNSCYEGNSIPIKTRQFIYEADATGNITSIIAGDMVLTADDNIIRFTDCFPRCYTEISYDSIKAIHGKYRGYIATNRDPNSTIVHV